MASLTEIASLIPTLRGRGRVGACSSPDAGGRGRVGACSGPDATDPTRFGAADAAAGSVLDVGAAAGAVGVGVEAGDVAVGGAFGAAGDAAGRVFGAAGDAAGGAFGAAGDAGGGVIGAAGAASGGAFGAAGDAAGRVFGAAGAAGAMFGMADPDAASGSGAGGSVFEAAAPAGGSSTRTEAGAQALDAGQLPAVLTALPDAEVVAVLREATELSQLVEQVRLLTAGVIAIRSTRSVGHRGLAQALGHRSSVSLVQEITGSTKSEAARMVRVGEALLEGALGQAGGEGGPGAGGMAAGGNGADGNGGHADGPDGYGPDGRGANGHGTDHAGAADGSGTGGDGGADDHVGDGEAAGGAGPGGTGSGDAGDARGDDDGPWPARVDPLATPNGWQEPLRAALRDGVLTVAQFDAIRRGLGDPPAPGDDTEEPAVAAAVRGTREAWFHAAEQLVREAAERTVEELGGAARMMRDSLDPDGAQARYLARFERRSFRAYRDQDGVLRATVVFDDEGAVFFQAVQDAALRPRRGGPRFVDETEKTGAAALTDDPRTNDQLAYDLVMDVFRAGVLAQPQDVFGTRQAGVRLVTVQHSDGTPALVGHSEDYLTSFPASVIDQHVCDSGTVPVTVDSCGNPLDVGRESRLFTPRQRIALAIRDGGCRWPGCDRPSSYGEAHHIDEWVADNGRTDIDRGILLCRFHHGQLHYGGWRITREGKSDFVLHHPGGDTFILRPRAALTYAWAGIDPPPKRFRPAA